MKAHSSQGVINSSKPIADQHETSVNEKSSTKEQKKPVPILSYKAEIIFDMQQAGLIKELPKPIKKSISCQTVLPSAAAALRKGGSNALNEDKKANNEIPFINLERDNYIQDIARRKLLFNSLKADQDTDKFVQTLKSVSKPAPKKKRLRRHKTSFRIIKNNKNIKVIQNVICEYINDNKKFVNAEILKLPQYEKNAPFIPQTLEFADQLIEEKELFKEKYGFNEKNLRKNKCVLEQVVLNRLDKKLRVREKNKILKKPLPPGLLEDNEQDQQQSEMVGYKSGAQKNDLDGDKAINSNQLLAQNIAKQKQVELALPKIQESAAENQN